MFFRVAFNFTSKHCSVRNFSTPVGVSTIGKSKKKLAKFGAPIEKIKLPVETNPEKLVKFVCGSNILKEGKDIELKPDSEYPEWLWKLNTGKAVPLEEMDKDSKAYWIKVRKMARVHHNKLTKLKRF